MKLNINIDKKTNNIVVGVSTGPDSMALLYYLKNNTKYNIICAHINHNVRKQSQIEEKYLKEYCNKNNIIFESYKIKEYKQKNFENEAREYRYNFYKKVLKKYNTKYLFLAHHGDDLIETVLMKIARGSNLEGYAGIKEISKVDNYYIIRPLLNYTKEDILEYNHKNNIKYFIDSTNKNNKYTRNRYRINILPLLKKEDTNIHKKFLSYSKTLLEYDDYIKKETIKLTNKIYKNNELEISKLIKQDPFMQKNTLYNILNNLYNNKPNIITDKIINNIIDLSINKKNNIELNLPKQINVYKIDNKLIFKQKYINKKYKIELTDIVETDKYIIKKINNTNNNGNNICRLDSKTISLPLYIRNAKKGDKIKVLGLNGSKVVFDIVMENKIPKQIRESYPVLVDKNDDILWIPNLKKSQFNIEKKKNYDIILEYIEKEEN